MIIKKNANSPHESKKNTVLWNKPLIKKKGIEKITLHSMKELKHMGQFSE